MRRVLAVITLTALTGCATPYQKMGLTGGVEAQQVTSDTYRIIGRGNGYTEATTIQDYVLLKAAETTKAAGGTHFIPVGSEDRTRQSFDQLPGTARTTVIGSTAFTTFTPGATYDIVKPGQDTYIRVISVKKGQPVPPAALSADEIIQFVGPRVTKT